MKHWLITALFTAISLSAFAAPDAAEIEELRWVDEGFLSRHRQTIEEITKMEFGSRLRGDKSDLRLLQRIIENGYIGQTDIKQQQALGVVLGDVFVKELGLEWVTYTDNDGKSRATCLPKTQHCLFPVTMLSKRMKLGVNPDVNEMFKNGESYLKPYIPKLPYTAD